MFKHGRVYFDRVHIEQFLASALISCSLKTPENQSFVGAFICGGFREYQIGVLAGNGLNLKNN